jgi:hypothetical protein
VAIASHFFKFQAQAAINTLISSPTCPLSRFLDNLKSIATIFLFWQKLGLFFVKYLRFFAALDKKQFC